MKRNILIAILVLCLGIAGYTFFTAWRMQDPEFQRERTLGAVRMFDVPDDSRKFVDMDEFAQKRPEKEGTKFIEVQMPPIAFVAAVKQAPQVIKTEYLTTAFGVIGLNPQPQVTHRMFVETSGGKIMPVYVWDDVAANFTEGPDPQRMLGFHIYTYSKGPAIVVDGVI